MLCTEMGNEWLEMVMRQLANNSLYIDRFLQGYPVLRGVRARGGSSIWVNLPENLPSAYFVNYLSKFAEVDCWDNRRFYPSDVNGFRISIGAAFTTIKEACDRIAIHLPKVIEAVEMKR
jgi:bifunctional pyridoxal-dependent enzyme with beta-cystathionase and maltose regulon repressor activities